MNCNLCPRNCNIDREKAVGFCKAPEKIVISKVMLHTGEEPFLTNNGKPSGAIFFAGCNLQCVYCQNYEISHNIVGKEISASELANIFKFLEDKGAGNIDLVTPTHYTTQILNALKIYKPKVPVIWNTSGYESTQTIKNLEGFVDIYLADFKYQNDKYALKYSKAPNYFECAKSALIEMKRQISENKFENGQLIKGIVVRHLVLPSLTKDSFAVLDTIKNILGKNALVSIMSQYVPYKNAKKFPEINRTISKLEYKAVISHALKLGLTNALVQDYSSATCDMIPNFNNQIIDI